MVAIPERVLERAYTRVEPGVGTTRKEIDMPVYGLKTSLAACRNTGAQVELVSA